MNLNLFQRYTLKDLDDYFTLFSKQMLGGYYVVITLLQRCETVPLFPVSTPCYCSSKSGNPGLRTLVDFTRIWDPTFEKNQIRIRPSKKPDPD